MNVYNSKVKVNVALVINDLDIHGLKISVAKRDNGEYKSKI